MTATMESTTGCAAIVQRTALLAILDAAKPTMFRSRPALSCVKMAFANDAMDVITTDLEVCTKLTTTQVQIEMVGECLVPQNQLRGVIAKAEGDTVHLKMDKDRLQIKDESGVFKLNTADLKEFPPIPELDGEPDFIVLSSDLRRCLLQAKFAVSRTETRFSLIGMRMEAAKELTMVGSDGRCMAISTAPLLVPPKNKVSCVMPQKCFAALERMLDDPDDQIGVHIRDNAVKFSLPYGSLWSNLVEGAYVDWPSLVPRNSHKITVGTVGLRNAIDRAALLADDVASAPTVAIALAFSASGIEMKSADPARGESEVYFPCKYNGPNMKIGVKPDYLLGTLRACDTDEITLELEPNSRAMLIRSGPMFQCVQWLVNLQ